MSLKKITINGNSIEPTLHGPGRELSSLDAPDASGTKHILIQTEGPLSSEQKGDLRASGVIIENYISENTYLCEYDPSDLETLRSKTFVNYANVYLPQLKASPTLKQRTPASTSIEGSTTTKKHVNLVFHDGVDASSAEIKSTVAGKAHVEEEDMAISSRKIRLKVDQQYLDDLAAIDEVRSMEEVRTPRLFNNIARGILEADVSVKGTSYSGEGQVVAVADTGFDKGQATGDVHPAFEGRVRKLYPRGKPDAADPDGGGGHGTHVCGSVLGNARSDKLGITVQGTAPEAALVMQACSNRDGALTGIPHDLEILFNQPYSSDKARVHTNSWGTPLSPDLKQGEYDSAATDIDQFIWDHKDMVICFAAGNDGMDMDRNGVVDARQIGSEAAAKNCITVGASENRRPDVTNVYSDFGDGPIKFPVNPLNRDRIANNPEGMAAFSSRGPSAEDRIKPDVTAPGTAILSARARGLSPRLPASSDPLWAFMSGTSMACPLVAGCAAVLRETLVKNGHPKPTAALIKALLINGAVNMAGQYQTADVGPSPNSINGWGRVNLAGSIIIPGAESNGGLGEGEPLNEGEDNTFVINIPEKGKDEDQANGTDDGRQVPLLRGSGGATLKITLVWSDFPGALLQNDLDLIVVAANGEERHGNMGTTAEFDRKNNVEQVVWHDMPAGEAKVTVHCERITRHAQDYAYAWRIS
ncbi:MAG: hypothetical protein Q9217_001109 [Psora testacea]